MELWVCEILELVASQFSRVLKVDNHIIDKSNAKFVHLCVELDLNQPLQQGTWVKYGENSFFILVLYEKSAIFCFSCGRVGTVKAPVFTSAISSTQSVCAACDFGSREGAE